MLPSMRPTVSLRTGRFPAEAGFMLGVPASARQGVPDIPDTPTGRLPLRARCVDVQ